MSLTSKNIKELTKQGFVPIEKLKKGAVVTQLIRGSVITRRGLHYFQKDRTNHKALTVERRTESFVELKEGGSIEQLPVKFSYLYYAKPA